MVHVTIIYHDPETSPEEFDCLYCKPKEGGVFQFTFREGDASKFRFIPVDLVQEVITVTTGDHVSGHDEEREEEKHPKKRRF